MLKIGDKIYCPAEKGMIVDDFEGVYKITRISSNGKLASAIHTTRNWPWEDIPNDPALLVFNEKKGYYELRQ